MTTSKVTKVLIKRGNTQQNNTYTGVYGELSIDMEANNLRIHDGVVPGGNIVSGTGGGGNVVITGSTYSNTNVKAYLTSFDGNIIPTGNGVQSLGSITHQWKSLFVSNNTIYLNGIPLSVTNNGNLTVNGNPISATVSYGSIIGAPTDISQFTDTGNLLIGTPGPRGNTGATGNAGPTGTSITSTQVVGGNLKVTFSNSTMVWAGNVLGPQGVQGIQGNTGHQGNTGTSITDAHVVGSNLKITFSDSTMVWAGNVLGPQGPQGEKGNSGDQGASGADGAQGPQGIQGNVGPQGPQGVQGIQGNVGSQGPRGFTGNVGDQGPQGDPGQKGDTGAQGISVTLKGSVQFVANLPMTGNAGEGWIVQGDGNLYIWNGSTVHWDDIGQIVGPQGDPGPQGPRGFTGNVGAQGPAGDQGPIGPQGTQGIQGNIGPQGSEGPRGFDGNVGPQGNAGVGVSPGGTIGQFLGKNSSDDYDTSWQDVSKLINGANELVLNVDGTTTFPGGLRLPEGYVDITTLSAGTDNKDIDIYTNEWAGGGVEVYLQHDNNVGIYTANGIHSWIFDKTGKLTFPGDIVPNVDNLQDIGTPTNRIRHIYVGPGSISIGDSVLSESTTGKLVVPGLTRATSLHADEVEDTGDQTTSFGSVPIIIDYYEWSVQMGATPDPTYVAAEYSVNGLDGEGYIDGISIDVSGTWTQAIANDNKSHSMYAYNGASWISIPFRVRAKANDVEYEFSTGGGSGVTVGLYDAENSLTNEVSGITTIGFDQTTGFNITEMDGNAIKVSLGSSWKTWQVDGQDPLVAVGEDTVTFVAGTNMTINTNALDKTITFNSTGGGGGGGSITVQERYFDYAYYNTWGTTDLTAQTAVGDDDNEYEISLPFAVQFLGNTYETVYLNSNSYLTFDSTTSPYWPLGPATMGVPAILVGATDREIINYYYGVTGDGRFVIRYEGVEKNYQGDLTQAPRRVWEIWFNEIIPSTITLVVDSDDIGQTGVWGIHDGVKWIDIYEPLPHKDQNTGDTVNAVDIVSRGSDVVDNFKFIGQGVETYIDGTTAYVEINPLQGILGVSLDSSGDSVITSAGFGLTLKSAHNDDIKLESTQDIRLTALNGTDSQPEDGGQIYINAGNGGGTGDYANKNGGHVYIDAGRASGTGTAGSIFLQTYPGSNNQWTFGQDGALRFPSSLTIQSNPYVSGTIISQDNALVQIATTGTGATTVGWSEYQDAPGSIAFASFNQTAGTVSLITGNVLTTTNTWDFQADGNIRFPDGSLQTTAYISGSNANTGDYVFNNNLLYLSNLDESIYLTAEMSVGGQSQLALEAGNLSPTKLQGVYDVNIVANAAEVAAKYWTFFADGTLQLPGPAADTTSYTRIRGGDAFLNLDVQYNSLNDVYGGARFGTNTAAPVDIITDFNGTHNTWRFDLDGSIIFPDNTVQTTAWTGNAGIRVSVEISDDAPTLTDGQLWFNSSDGRAYVKYNGTFVDLSPAVVPPTSIYTGDLEIENSTITNTNLDDEAIMLTPGSKTWRFTDEGVNFPDGTRQETAFTVANILEIDGGEASTWLTA